MVHHDQEQMFLRAQPEKRSANERPADKVKGTRGFGFHGGLGASFAFVGGNLAQVDRFQDNWLRLIEDLNRRAIDGRKASAEDFVALDDLGDRALKRAAIQRTV